MNSSNPAQEAASDGARSEKLQISGMRCAACAQIISYRLQQLPGINALQFIPGTAQLKVEWDGQRLKLQQIVDAVVALGYRALPMAQGEMDAVLARENRLQWWRLFVAGFAMMQIMMYAFPAWLEPVPSVDGDLTPDIDLLLKLASLALSLPVMIFSSTPFYRSALRDLRNRHIGMDVPVCIGIFATFIASLWATFAGGAVYYDSLVMFVFLLLAARMVEERVQQKANAALHELTSLSPPQALLCATYPQQREVQTVPAAEIKPGQVVQVLPGAQVPVDGLVLEGNSACDEALLSGESAAVGKQIGDRVIAGALNLSGSLWVRAEQVGADTRLAGMVAMMENAAGEKPALVQLADRHASRFLMAIILLAALAGLVWWQIDPARALPIALTVLVITCPCALSLATPAVMAAVSGRLARRGVLVARGRAIESLAQAQVFVFDKTGTLSNGKLSVVAQQVLRTENQAGGVTFAASEGIWRTLAAQLARHSLHPVAQALAQEETAQPDWPALQNVQEVQEVAGQGLQGRLGSGLLRLGRPEFVQQLHGQELPPLPPALQACSVVALGDEQGWLAIFGLRDQIRPQAGALLAALQAARKQVWILSGDRQEVVSATARELGVPAEHALGQLLPEQKHARVRALQAQGWQVAVCGDGMNDGPVLSLANVSIAIGQGAPITQARSDVVLVSSNLGDLQAALTACAKAMQLIRQNLGWAALYNVLAIPLACSGALAPWHAALGMSLSSLLVLLNSLRMLSGSKAELEALHAATPATPAALPGWAGT